MMTAAISPNIEASARASLHRRLARQTQRASATREIPPPLDLKPTKVTRRKRESADG